MADSKITALTAFTSGALSSSDVFVMVDVSDTTMAASGTDKKITLGDVVVAGLPLGDTYGQVQGVDTVTTTNYTLVLTDAGRLKLLNTTTVGVFRLPLNASVALPVGVHVDGAMVNTGQFTITTQAGVILIANPASPKTTTSAAFSVIKTATDTWLATGYLV